MYVIQLHESVNDVVETMLNKYNRNKVQFTRDKCFAQVEYYTDEITERSRVDLVSRRLRISIYDHRKDYYTIPLQLLFALEYYDYNYDQLDRDQFIRLLRMNTYFHINPSYWYHPSLRKYREYNNKKKT